MLLANHSYSVVFSRSSSLAVPVSSTDTLLPLPLLLVPLLDESRSPLSNWVTLPHWTQSNTICPDAMSLFAPRCRGFSRELLARGLRGCVGGRCRTCAVVVVSPSQMCLPAFSLFFFFPFVVGVVIFRILLGGKPPLPSRLSLSSLVGWEDPFLPGCLGRLPPCWLCVWEEGRGGSGTLFPHTLSVWAVFTSLS